MISGCTPDTDGSCSICGDVALPGIVIAVNAAEKTAEVSMADQTATATVALDLVDAVAPGDSLLVHLGFAITRLDKAEQ